MKAKIAIVLVALLVCPLLSRADELTDYYKNVGDIARLIMSSRQGGTPITKLIAFNEKTLEADLTDDPKKARLTRNTHKMIGLIIVDAYKQNRYSSESVKKRVIDEFSNKWVLWAMENTHIGDKK